MKKFEEFSNKDVTAEQIETMENELGEWIIDCCDISIYIADCEPYCKNLKMKSTVEKWFEEHYPET